MNAKADIEEGFGASQPTGLLAESSLPAAKARIDRHLKCRRCGRNLRGVSSDDNCPACGESIPDMLAAESKQLGGKLAGLTLPKQVLVLAIWPFLEQALNFLVGFVDTLLAGHLSVAATDAIAVASYIHWLVNILHMCIGVGATAVIARAIGGRHKRIANAALGQAVVMAIVMGVVTGTAIFALAPWICSFMELRPESYPLGVTYLRIIALSAPLGSILFVGSACLRAAGDTRSPFVVLTVVNIVNAALSCLLVYGPGAIGGHGVAGIAWGTAVAWIVGALLILIVLSRGWGAIRLRFMRMRPHWHTMRRIIRVASSSLMESLGMWIGNFFVMKIVGIVNITVAAALGAHLIAVRLEAISYLPCMALGIAAATLTGQYLGLGDPARARLAARTCWLFGVVVMGSMGLVFWFFPEPMVRMVTDEPQLLAAAPDLLRICAPIQVFFATSIVLSNAMRGAGDTRSTMLLTFLSTYAIRLPAAYLLAVVMGYGLNGVWLALCGELVIRGILFSARFLHGGWARVNV